MPILRTTALFLLMVKGFANPALAENFTLVNNVTFGTAGARELKLDLYLPAGEKQDGLLVWIHGGAWRSGSKDRVPVKALVEMGWALASIDYRLSGEAPFPAQVHDIKAAIRFLRGKGEDFGVNADRVIIMGSSAGGHLAALVGVSNGVAELEGEIGDDLDQSSDVQGIISLYGASNLTTILDQSTPHGLSVRVPALDQFIGGHPDDVPEAARLASPVFHVDKKDPPLLLMHGDQDPQMPINQSHELHGKYKQLRLPVEFVVVHGAGHGGSAFYDEQHIAMMARYLEFSLGHPD